MRVEGVCAKRSDNIEQQVVEHSEEGRAVSGNVDVQDWWNGRMLQMMGVVNRRSDEWLS